MLLDMEMPEMTGFGCSGTRERPQAARPAGDRDLVLEGVEASRAASSWARDYLHKPVNPMLLKARLGASLEEAAARPAERDGAALRHLGGGAGRGESGFALGGHRVQGSVRSPTSAASRAWWSAATGETIELLNTYYTLMFDAISARGGVVNQMVGDGLMAIFGAPLPLDQPARSAVAAAREMIELIGLFNQEQAASKKPAIRIGIGIASGEMVAGYTGTHERATYTCVGNTVNLAARLEAYTKEAQRPILIEGQRGRLGEA